MKYTYLLVFISIVISISCNNNKEKNLTDNINNNDFVDIAIPYDTLQHDEATIEYTPLILTDAKWSKYLEESDMKVTNMEWSNNNIFTTAEVRVKHSLEYLQFWVIDASGKIILSQKIDKPEQAGYEEYNSFVIPQKDTYPTFYYLQESFSHKTYASDSNRDPQILIQSMNRYSITRLIWSNSLKDYEKKENLLGDALKNFIIDNEINYVRKVNLKKIGNNIIVFGEANTQKSRYSSNPYLVLLNKDLEVLYAQIYEDEKYAYTYIDELKKLPNNNIMIIATKQEGIDGSYYYTNMKFEVDKNLKLVKDYSETEPYYSFYRGPSAPDYTDDEEKNEETDDDGVIITNKEAIQVKEEAIKSKDVTDKILDSDNNFDFTINYNEDKKGIFILKKTDTRNNSIMYKRIFNLSENFSYRMAVNTSDGGFIIAFEERKRVLTLKDYEKNNTTTNLVCFKFNKEGNLTEQFEVVNTYGRVGYLNILNTKNNEFIVAFLLTNAYFDGKDWHYPDKLGFACFSYRNPPEK